MKKQFLGFTFLLAIVCINYSSIFYAQKPKTPPSSEEKLVTKGASENQESQENQKELIIAEVDQDFRRQKAIELVNQGIEYFMGHSLPDSCHKFSHTNEFIYGELYLFVIDDTGTILAHGDQVKLLWQDYYNKQDTFGEFFVQHMIKRAKQGGGWITYAWQNTTKNSYVKEVIKDGKSYLIGCGYYPHSKQDNVVSLVRGAVADFNNKIKDGQNPGDIFGDFTYPLGKFVFGDLYIFVIDDNGNLFAQGDRPNLVGSNVIDYQDTQGKFVNKEIISRLKNEELGRGIWIDYYSKNVAKKSYVERVQDSTGKNYFIAAGFHPSVGEKDVVDLVGRGYQYMKRQGLTQAADEFTDIDKNDFRYGDLYLIAYGLSDDIKGYVYAHGGNPGLRGQNHWNEKDDHGHLYVQEILRIAQNGGGWLSFAKNNSFFSVYVEKIKLGLGEYAIAALHYPINKAETMELLVAQGIEHLKVHGRDKAAGGFSEFGGGYVRGDIDLFMLDVNGIAYAYGSKSNFIWRNLLILKDEKGKRYLQEIINLTKAGPATVTFVKNGVQKVGYAKRVTIGDEIYIIGSSYYTYQELKEKKEDNKIDNESSQDEEGDVEA